MGFLSPTGKEALIYNKQKILNFLEDKNIRLENIRAIWIELQKLLAGGVVGTKNIQLAFEKMKNYATPDVIDAVKQYIGYSSKTLDVTDKTRKAIDNLSDMFLTNMEKRKISSLKEVKFTKSYIKQVIVEEINKLNENPAVFDDSRLTSGFTPDELAVYNAFKTLNDLNSLDGKAKEKLSAYPRVKSALINRANLTIRK